MLQLSKRVCLYTVRVKNPLNGCYRSQARRRDALGEARYEALVPEVESVGTVENFTALKVAADNVSTLEATGTTTSDDAWWECRSKNQNKKKRGNSR